MTATGRETMVATDRKDGCHLRKRFVVALGVLGLVVAACGGAASPAAPSEPAATEPGASPSPSGPALAAEQILRIDLGVEPPTLDPNLAQDSTSIAVLNALHRGLTYYDKDLNAAPAVAERWDLSDDGKTITFHLRPDAVYSNGEPIVADDFVYSWKRLMDPRTAAPYAYNMLDVVGAAEVESIDPADGAAIDAALANVGLSAPDPHTFVVNLTKPAAYFPWIAGLWHSAPMKESWITQPGATEAANYVSSGPFILDEWVHNSNITLKPNPNWYGEKPILTEIQMSMIEEPAQGQAAYENGELDMFLTPQADIRRMQQERAAEVVNSPQFAIGYYGYNMQGPYTKNQNFRAALSSAIDKKALIDVAWGGTGIVANTIIPPGMLAYQEDLDPYPYDPEKAKEYLATALQELGIASVADLPPLKFIYNTGSDHEARVAFMAQAWKDVLGIETDQVGSEWSTFLTSRHNLEYDIARNAWGQDYPHPNNFLNDLFRCGGGNNDEGYCNEQFDALIDQASQEPDAAKQAELYKQAETILMNEQPVIPLRFPVTAYTVAPYVKGLVVTPGDAQLPGDLFYETIYLEDH
jgi:oligopeptide transport system substrate-binding protein